MRVNGAMEGSQDGRGRAKKKQAPTTASEIEDNERSYTAAVLEGKQILADIESSRDKLMRLGELAARVEKSYGEKKLTQFAGDVGIAVCRLARCRSVVRAWQGKEAPAPKSYAVAQELQAHPDRFKIVKDKPDITKSEARRLRLEWQGKAKPEKAKPDSLRGHTQRWFKGLVRLANGISREAQIAHVDQIEPELAQAWREEIEPGLVPILRQGGELLIKLAALLEKVLQEEPPKEEPQQTAQAA